MAAPPHEPPDARYTAAEFQLYREGYDQALLMALKVVTAAEKRCELVERTKRLERKRKRGKQ